MTNQKICSNCGCQLEDNMKCCPNCGAPVNNEVINREKTEEEPFPPEEIDMLSDQGTNSSNPYISKKLVVIGISILAIILVALFASRIQSKDPVQQAIDNRSQESSFVQNSYPSNVENGLGDLGARFNFTQTEFIQRSNTIFYQNTNNTDTDLLPPIGSWENNQSHAEDSGINTVIYNYSFSNNSMTFVFSTTTEEESGKVIQIGIGIPYGLYNQDPSVFQTIVVNEIMAVCDLDINSATTLFYHAAAVIADGGKPCYNNIALSLYVSDNQSSVIYFIAPISEESKKDLNVTMIDDH